MSNTITPTQGEEQGRIISWYEYVAQLNERPDIFIVEKEKHLKVLLPLMLILGLFFSGYTTWILDISSFDIGFSIRHTPTIAVSLSPQAVELPPKMVVTPTVTKPKLSALQPPTQDKHHFSAPRKTGTRDVTITKRGLIGVLNQQITTIASANSKVFGSTGDKVGVDAVLAGLGSLADGKSGSGRVGIQSLGDGVGTIAGNGAGTGGIGDIENLMYSGASTTLKISHRKPRKIEVPLSSASSSLSGHRSKSAINRTVRQNLRALRYAFNKQLRHSPSAHGKITVTWAIDEFGNVLFAKIIADTINDQAFANEILRKIKLWQFGKIDKPGDVTEVEYPFVFTH